MLPIDEEVLGDVGLADLEPEDRSSLVAAALAELEARVGERLSSLMSVEGLDEFDEALTSGDEARVQAVLSRRIPQYPKIVTAETGKMRAQLAARAPEILMRLPARKQPAGS